MINGIEDEFSAFLVHAYPDLKKNRLYLQGRLSDRRSFAAVEEDWRPYIHVFEESFPKVMQLFKPFKMEEIPALNPFPGLNKEKLICLKFANYNDRSRASRMLEDNQIPSPDADIKPAELFLTEKQIRGPVNIKGTLQPGKRVDAVFRRPYISAPKQPVSIPLRIASVDIETDVASGIIRAISVAWADTHNNEIQINDNDINGKIRVLSPADSSFHTPDSSFPVFHNDEKSMLASFLEDIRIIDPDILTGWNFLDFDFPHLAQRYERFGLSFSAGRSKDSAKFFPGDDSAAKAAYSGGSWRRRSAAAIVPGRQVLDALRIMRAGTQWTAGQGFSLDEIAQKVLGEGKTVHETGDEKITALDRLYLNDPVLFGEYCLRDSQLVLRILSKTGLYRLTMERAGLTGVSLDKAWTSVVSFERIYGMQLRKKGIAPAVHVSSDVTGAAGGTVLESEQGLFNNVAVFDFRSLYPTVMRTFNIDPLSHARAADETGGNKIIAPNGAEFSREPGLLPVLISEYFATRAAALEKGDSIAAQVFKILMNSFYGVLGTSSCRYGKSSLAGAVTSFARKWLLFSRDWFNSGGLRVLYGDTDSLFIDTGFDDIPLAEFKERCCALANEVNYLIAESIKKEYDLASFIELRFDKAYRRFLIPPVRNIHASGDSPQLRGRAKGYGGYILRSDGSLTVDVVGMEAVRSDSTPLARRLQLEILEIVFSGQGENELRRKVDETITGLLGGKHDHELVYRKRLTRYPETYTSSTPPQVKAARALGWKKRRGTVEYLWTVNGPEPAGLPHGKPDYDHYIETQIFPLVRSIASAVRWDTDYFVIRKGDSLPDKQIEMMF